MRAKLAGLVLIVWLALFGYAAVYSMILGRELRFFWILDIVLHGLVVFVAFVVAFSGPRSVTAYIFGVLNLYTMGFVITLVVFDGEIVAYDVIVGFSALALCAGATVLVIRRARVANAISSRTRTDDSDDA